jgi:hypothetical protein
MAEKFTVIRIFKKDADGIRKEYPQYRSDAVRIREILRMRGSFLLAPEGAEFVPVIKVPESKMTDPRGD